MTGQRRRIYLECNRLTTTVPAPASDWWHHVPKAIERTHIISFSIRRFQSRIGVEIELDLKLKFNIKLDSTQNSHFHIPEKLFLEIERLK